MAVDLSGKRLRFWSRGLVCQTKKVNACGHIPVHDLTVAYSEEPLAGDLINLLLLLLLYVISKRRTLIRGKSIHESFRGSILGSIIVECKRKLSVETFGASTKMVNSETLTCEQQAAPIKSARRKECDHVRSAFRFDKQSHVTEMAIVWRPNQLSLLSLNSRSTCFGSMKRPVLIKKVQVQDANHCCLCLIFDQATMAQEQKYLIYENF